MSKDDTYPPLSERGLPILWENVLKTIVPLPLGPSTRIMYMAPSRAEAERIWEAFSPEERQRVVVEWRGAYSYLSDHPDMKEGSALRLTDVRWQIRGVLDDLRWAEEIDGPLVAIPEDLRERVVKSIDELIARAFR